MEPINFYFKYIIIISSFLTQGNCVTGQDQILAKDNISILFIGDIMGHDDQIRSAKDTLSHKYNYDSVFKYIKPAISEADIAIANFEVTLAGPPYMGYPRFSSPADLASACKNAGIDYLVTANNHAADRGNKGIISTISKLDSIGINHTGTFINDEEKTSRSPLMIQRSGISIALLNYTYGTNGIDIPEPVIVNIINKDLITNDIEKAKNNNADIVILFLHWGLEYDTIPSASQTEMAEYFFSIGADMIIGSHPHVLQKMVWKKNITEGNDEIVVYSLGNFVSNQRKPGTDGGSMVRIELAVNADSCWIANAGYYLTWVHVPVEEGRKKYFILPCSRFEKQSSFFSNPADFQKMKDFINSSRNLLYKQNKNIPEYIFNENAWTIAN
jgi:poly-gamma-glutamate capsule biosynthesis protein CapA/YwtB (metallophosphatase superfamily)